MKSIWLLFSCPGSGRQNHDLAGDFNLGGVGAGGELEFEDRKPQSVYKGRDLLLRQLMSSLRWGGVLMDVV